MTSHATRLLFRIGAHRALALIALSGILPDAAFAQSRRSNFSVLKPVDFQAFVEAVMQLGVFWTVHHRPLLDHRP